MTSLSHAIADPSPLTIQEPQLGGITPADLRRAAWASSLGSALEYYDFALYSLASALISGPCSSPRRSPASP